MLANLHTHKLLWFLTTLLTLVAASLGALFPNIYNNVFPNEFIPGALPQDILTIIVCLTLFVLIQQTKEDNYKKQIIIIGAIGSFFYLYGIFAIERVYNYLYLLYLTIVALSFWSTIYSLTQIKKEVIARLQLTPAVAKTTAISGLVIGMLFTALWITALFPLMREHNRIDYLYSIYILDLCFIMPAFFITSISSFAKKSIGNALAPAVFIVGFFVIFPLGLGEIAKPYYGITPNYSMMTVSFAFSLFMLAIAIVQLNKTHINLHTMEDKKALEILLEMTKKYPFTPEEKEALSEAVGTLSWTSLGQSRMRSIKAKRDAEKYI